MAVSIGVLVGTALPSPAVPACCPPPPLSPVAPIGVGLGGLTCIRLPARAAPGCQWLLLLCPPRRSKILPFVEQPASLSRYRRKTGQGVAGTCPSRRPRPGGQTLQAALEGRSRSHRTFAASPTIAGWLARRRTIGMIEHCHFSCRAKPSWGWREFIIFLMKSSHSMRPKLFGTALACSGLGQLQLG